MKLSNLAGEEATCVVPVPEWNDEVKVVYRPGALTLETAEKLQEARESDFPVRAISALLEPMLVSWDLQKDDGSELPANAETLKKVPLSFLGRLIEQLTTDNAPTEQEGKASGDGSQPAESSENLPITTP